MPDRVYARHIDLAALARLREPLDRWKVRPYIELSARVGFESL